MNKAFISSASAAAQHPWPVCRLSGTSATLRTPGSALGEHGGEVLGELLVPDEAQIAALRAKSVI